MEKENESESAPLLTHQNSSVNYDSEVGFLQPTSVGQSTWSERCPSAQNLELDSETASLLPLHFQRQTERPPDETVDVGGTNGPGHCHNGPLSPELDTTARRRLILACVICLLFMVGEITGGVLAHSLAIISDAAHLLTDIASFLISLLSLYLANRPSTQRFSYGLQRTEILGALVSILLLWVLTGVLAYEAVQRVIYKDFEINAKVMLITAGVGVAVNLILAVTLHQSHGHSHGMGHGHSHSNSHSHSHSHGNGSSLQGQHHANGGEYERLTSTAEVSNGNYGALANNSSGAPAKHAHKKSNFNVTASFIHVLGDLIQSLGVLTAAFIIYYKPSWKLADPICTFIFSFIVICTTISILRDILVVLMEGAPRDIDVARVRKAFYTIKGVKNVHNLRIWSLSVSVPALSVHIAVESGADTHRILKAAAFLINMEFGIKETTMQVEEYVPEMSDCTSCQHLND